MCLILFATNPNNRYRLVVAANRDELYARPTQVAQFWESDPNILAGRDENMGGTWLGVNRSSCFSAVTNFREEPAEPLPPHSRGDLPTAYLREQQTPEEYVSTVSELGGDYKGFNLIVADGQACHYYGNRAGQARKLKDGYYGLSNQLLDCNWPKVIDGCAQLQQLLSKFPSDTDLVESLFDILLSRGDHRDFSNSFISSDTYGTRAATVVLIEKNGDVYFEERNFEEEGKPIQANQFRLKSSGGF